MLADSAIKASLDATRRAREPQRMITLVNDDGSTYEIPDMTIVGPGVYAYEGLDIVPFDPERLNPASVDLTLSPVWRNIAQGAVLDTASIHIGHTNRHIALSEILLRPGDFILAATNEVITIPRNLAARVEGKSSLGRLGIAVHITAGFIDPGFSGSITLEIANLSGRTIVLHPGMRIAQIAFEPMQGDVHKPYGKTGHYQDQPASEPVESRYVL